MRTPVGAGFPGSRPRLELIAESAGRRSLRPVPDAQRVRPVEERFIGLVARGVGKRRARLFAQRRNAPPAERLFRRDERDPVREPERDECSRDPRAAFAEHAGDPAPGERPQGLTEVDPTVSVEANVFDLLGKMERAGERFDAIVLDPPAFAKSRGSAEAAGRGYKEINLRAIKMLSPGGTLITSTCSYHMSEDDFLNLLSQASSDAGRSVRILEKRMQAPDHPVLVSMPETYYLKCVVLSAL